MATLINGVHHIALKAKDYDKSYAFYRDTLGFTPLYHWGEGEGRAAMLDMGAASCLELFANGAGEAPQGGWVHLALRTGDCKAAFDAAIQAGAKVKSPPTETTIPAREKPLHVCIAFVYGFDGEEIEFFQVLD